MTQLALDEAFIERRSRLSGGELHAWLLKDPLHHTISDADSFTLAAEILEDGIILNDGPEPLAGETMVNVGRLHLLEQSRKICNAAFQYRKITPTSNLPGVKYDNDLGLSAIEG